ncbi:MAG: hypothetical protein M1338_00655 [Patescibacteria group bacterium]|nr:hypothetical protein [Patescibacteria group bacterium]
MNEENKSPKSFLAKWWWIIILIIIALSALLIFLRGDEDTWIKDKMGNWIKHGNPSSTAPSPKASAVKEAEAWTKDPTVLMTNTTSTDTHKISEGLFRMFLNGQGGIAYVETADGKTFSSLISTKVTEDSGKMISNPATLQLADNSWIMLYEQAPRKNPGQKDGPPGTANQRNLYLATSSDGKNFTKQGIAVDSSKEDDYFASVPDLVLLPNNNIRLYYVCGGESICSRLSSDNGKTWVKESGYRLADMAVDPDVKIKIADNKTKWVMYYSILEPSKNGLYKAISEDGLTWTPLKNQIISKTKDNALVDPDVIEFTPNTWVMYFGQSGGASSTGGEQINLFRATYSGDIFAN